MEERVALKTARAGSSFWVTLTDGTGVRCERLLLATGGNRSSAGFTIAQALGHTIEPLVPSLFTFHIDDARLVGLSGVSLENAVTAVAARVHARPAERTIRRPMLFMIFTSSRRTRREGRGQNRD